MYKVYSKLWQPWCHHFGFFCIFFIISTISGVYFCYFRKFAEFCFFQKSPDFPMCPLALILVFLRIKSFIKKSASFVCMPIKGLLLIIKSIWGFVIICSWITLLIIVNKLCSYLHFIRFLSLGRLILCLCYIYCLHVNFFLFWFQFVDRIQRYLICYLHMLSYQMYVLGFISLYLFVYW